MAQRENNTMAEGCDKLLKQIASMEQEPDADMEFLGALRGDILSYLKPPTPQPAAGPQPGGPGADPTGGMNGAMASVMGAPQAGGSVNPPSADMLQRQLSPS